MHWLITLKKTIELKTCYIALINFVQFLFSIWKTNLHVLDSIQTTQIYNLSPRDVQKVSVWNYMTSSIWYFYCNCIFLYSYILTNTKRLVGLNNVKVIFVEQGLCQFNWINPPLQTSFYAKKLFIWRIS